MNIESISKKTGKFTGKALSAIVSAPEKTASKSKRISEAFVAGYKGTAPKKISNEVIDTTTV